MLGKLIKHEFRATARIMWPLLLSLIAVAFPARFGILYMQTPPGSPALDLLSGLSVTALIVGIFAVVIVAVWLMVQRFQKNLLEDEGYIMFTLPTSVHGLIWSKLLVSAVWFLATFAAVMAVMVIAVGSVQQYDLLWGIEELL